MNDNYSFISKCFHYVPDEVKISGFISCFLVENKLTEKLNHIVIFDAKKKKYNKKRMEYDLVSWHIDDEFVVVKEEFDYVDMKVCMNFQPFVNILDGQNNNLDILYQSIKNVIIVICQLSVHECVCSHLVHKHPHYFLKYNTFINPMTGQFQILNTHTIIKLPEFKDNRKILKKQFMSIFQLLKYIFFVYVNSLKKDWQHYCKTQYCKLKLMQPRFRTIPKDAYSFYHKIICTKFNEDTISNLETLLNDEEAIDHLRLVISKLIY